MADITRLAYSAQVALALLSAAMIVAGYYYNVWLGAGATFVWAIAFTLYTLRRKRHEAARLEAEGKWRDTAIETEP